MDQAGYWRGLRLFNAAEFFEAHEVLEDVWRAAPGDEKQFLQGLIQIAVAFVHYQRGNRIGAQSLLTRGSRNLSSYPEEYAGLRVAELLIETRQWRDALAERRVPPRFPRVVWNGSSSIPG